MGEEIYKKVRTFDQLLSTNVAFFQGDLPHTFYYNDAWGAASDSIQHIATGGDTTNTLIELARDHGVFSVNGQSSYCHENRENIRIAEALVHESIRIMLSTQSPGEAAEAREDIKRGMDMLETARRQVTVQRSYLDFFIEGRRLASIFEKLVTDPRVQVVIVSPNGDVITNVDQPDAEFVNVTDTFTRLRIDAGGRNMYIKTAEAYPRIRKMLSNACFVSLINRNFCAAPTADAILLELFTGKRSINMTVKAQSKSSNMKSLTRFATQSSKSPKNSRKNSRKKNSRKNSM